MSDISSDTLSPLKIKLSDFKKLKNNKATLSSTLKRQLDNDYASKSGSHFLNQKEKVNQSEKLSNSRQSSIDEMKQSSHRQPEGKNIKVSSPHRLEETKKLLKRITMKETLTSMNRQVISSKFEESYDTSDHENDENVNFILLQNRQSASNRRSVSEPRASSRSLDVPVEYKESLSFQRKIGNNNDHRISQSSSDDGDDMMWNPRNFSTEIAEGYQIFDRFISLIEKTSTLNEFVSVLDQIRLSSDLKTVGVNFIQFWMSPSNQNGHYYPWSSERYSSKISKNLIHNIFHNQKSKTFTEYPSIITLHNDSDEYKQLLPHLQVLFSTVESNIASIDIIKLHSKYDELDIFTVLIKEELEIGRNSSHRFSGNGSVKRLMWSRCWPQLLYAIHSQYTNLTSKCNINTSSNLIKGYEADIRRYKELINYQDKLKSSLSVDELLQLLVSSVQRIFSCEIVSLISPLSFRHDFDMFPVKFMIHSVNEQSKVFTVDGPDIMDLYESLRAQDRHDHHSFSFNADLDSKELELIFPECYEEVTNINNHPVVVPLKIQIDSNCEKCNKNQAVFSYLIIISNVEINHEMKSIISSMIDLTEQFILNMLRIRHCRIAKAISDISDDLNNRLTESDSDNDLFSLTSFLERINISFGNNQSTGVRNTSVFLDDSFVQSLGLDRCSLDNPTEMSIFYRCDHEKYGKLNPIKTTIDILATDWYNDLWEGRHVVFEPTKDNTFIDALLLDIFAPEINPEHIRMIIVVPIRIKHGLVCFVFSEMQSKSVSSLNHMNHQINGFIPKFDDNISMGNVFDRRSLLVEHNFSNRFHAVFETIASLHLRSQKLTNFEKKSFKLDGFYEKMIQVFHFRRKRKYFTQWKQYSQWNRNQSLEVSMNRYLLFTDRLLCLSPHRLSKQEYLSVLKEQLSEILPMYDLTLFPEDLNDTDHESTFKTFAAMDLSSKIIILDNYMNNETYKNTYSIDLSDVTLIGCIKFYDVHDDYRFGHIIATIKFTPKLVFRSFPGMNVSTVCELCRVASFIYSYSVFPISRDRFYVDQSVSKEFIRTLSIVVEELTDIARHENIVDAWNSILPIALSDAKSLVGANIMVAKGSSLVEGSRVISSEDINDAKSSAIGNIISLTIQNSVSGISNQLKNRLTCQWFPHSNHDSQSRRHPFEVSAIECVHEENFSPAHQESLKLICLILNLVYINSNRINHLHGVLEEKNSVLSVLEQELHNTKTSMSSVSSTLLINESKRQYLHAMISFAVESSRSGTLHELSEIIELKLPILLGTTSTSLFIQHRLVRSKNKSDENHSNSDIYESGVWVYKQMNENTTNRQSHLELSFHHEVYEKYISLSELNQIPYYFSDPLAKHSKLILQDKSVMSSGQNLPIIGILISRAPESLAIQSESGRNEIRELEKVFPWEGMQDKLLSCMKIGIVSSIERFKLQDIKVDYTKIVGEFNRLIDQDEHLTNQVLQLQNEKEKDLEQMNEYQNLLDKKSLECASVQQQLEAVTEQLSLSLEELLIKELLINDMNSLLTSYANDPRTLHASTVLEWAKNYSDRIGVADIISFDRNETNGEFIIVDNLRNYEELISKCYDCLDNFEPQEVLLTRDISSKDVRSLIFAKTTESYLSNQQMNMKALIFPNKNVPKDIKDQSNSFIKRHVCFIYLIPDSRLTVSVKQLLVIMTQLLSHSLNDSMINHTQNEVTLLTKRIASLSDSKIWSERLTEVMETLRDLYIDHRAHSLNEIVKDLEVKIVSIISKRISNDLCTIDARIILLDDAIKFLIVGDEFKDKQLSSKTLSPKFIEHLITQGVEVQDIEIIVSVCHTRKSYYQGSVIFSLIKDINGNCHSIIKLEKRFNIRSYTGIDRSINDTSSTAVVSSSENKANRFIEQGVAENAHSQIIPTIDQLLFTPQDFKIVDLFCCNLSPLFDRVKVMNQLNNRLQGNIHGLDDYSKSIARLNDEISLKDEILSDWRIVVQEFADLLSSLSHDRTDYYGIINTAQKAICKLTRSSCCYLILPNDFFKAINILNDPCTYDSQKLRVNEWDQWVLFEVENEVPLSVKFEQDDLEYLSLVSNQSVCYPDHARALSSSLESDVTPIDRNPGALASFSKSWSIRRYISTVPNRKLRDCRHMLCVPFPLPTGSLALVVNIDPMDNIERSPIEFDSVHRLTQMFRISMKIYLDYCNMRQCEKLSANDQINQLKTEINQLTENQNVKEKLINSAIDELSSCTLLQGIVGDQSICSLRQEVLTIPYVQNHNGNESLVDSNRLAIAEPDSVFTSWTWLESYVKNICQCLFQSSNVVVWMDTPSSTRIRKYSDKSLIQSSFSKMTYWISKLSLSRIIDECQSIKHTDNEIKNLFDYEFYQNDGWETNSSYVNDPIGRYRIQMSLDIPSFPIIKMSVGIHSLRVFQDQKSSSTNSATGKNSREFQINSAYKFDSLQRLKSVLIQKLIESHIHWKLNIEYVNVRSNETYHELRREVITKNHQINETKKQYESLLNDNNLDNHMRLKQMKNDQTFQTYLENIYHSSIDWKTHSMIPSRIDLLDDSIAIYERSMLDILVRKLRHLQSSWYLNERREGHTDNISFNLHIAIVHHFNGNDNTIKSSHLQETLYVKFIDRDLMTSSLDNDHLIEYISQSIRHQVVYDFIVEPGDNHPFRECWDTNHPTVCVGDSFGIDIIKKSLKEFSEITKLRTLLKNINLRDNENMNNSTKEPSTDYELVNVFESMRMNDLRMNRSIGICDLNEGCIVRIVNFGIFTKPVSLLFLITPSNLSTAHMVQKNDHSNEIQATIESTSKMRNKSELDSIENRNQISCVTHSTITSILSFLKTWEASVTSNLSQQYQSMQLRNRLEIALLQRFAKNIDSRKLNLIVMKVSFLIWLRHVKNHNLRLAETKISQSRDFELKNSKLKLERLTADWTELMKGLNGASLQGLHDGVEGLWTHASRTLMSILSSKVKVNSIGLIVPSRSIYSLNDHNAAFEKNNRETSANRDVLLSRYIELIVKEFSTPLSRDDKRASFRIQQRIQSEGSSSREEVHSEVDDTYTDRYANLGVIEIQSLTIHSLNVINAIEAIFESSYDVDNTFSRSLSHHDKLFVISDPSTSYHRNLSPYKGYLFDMKSIQQDQQIWLAPIKTPKEIIGILRITIDSGSIQETMRVVSDPTTPAPRRRSPTRVNEPFEAYNPPLSTNESLANLSESLRLIDLEDVKSYLINYSEMLAPLLSAAKKINKFRRLIDKRNLKMYDIQEQQQIKDDQLQETRMTLALLSDALHQLGDEVMNRDYSSEVNHYVKSPESTLSKSFDDSNESWSEYDQKIFQDINQLLQRATKTLSNIFNNDFNINIAFQWAERRAKKQMNNRTTPIIRHDGSNRIITYLIPYGKHILGELSIRVVGLRNRDDHHNPDRSDSDRFESVVIPLCSIINGFVLGLVRESEAKKRVISSVETLTKLESLIIDQNSILKQYQQQIREVVNSHSICQDFEYVSHTTIEFINKNAYESAIRMSESQLNYTMIEKKDEADITTIDVSKLLQEINDNNLFHRYFIKLNQTLRGVICKILSQDDKDDNSKIAVMTRIGILNCYNSGLNDNLSNVFDNIHAYTHKSLGVPVESSSDHANHSNIHDMLCWYPNEGCIFSDFDEEVETNIKESLYVIDQQSLVSLRTCKPSSKVFKSSDRNLHVITSPIRLPLSHQDSIVNVSSECVGVGIIEIIVYDSNLRDTMNNSKHQTHPSSIDDDQTKIFEVCDSINRTMISTMMSYNYIYINSSKIIDDIHKKFLEDEQRMRDFETLTSMSRWRSDYQNQAMNVILIIFNQYHDQLNKTLIHMNNKDVDYHTKRRKNDNAVDVTSFEMFRSVLLSYEVQNQLHLIHLSLVIEDQDDGIFDRILHDDIKEETIDPTRILVPSNLLSDPTSKNRSQCVIVIKYERTLNDQESIISHRLDKQTINTSMQLIGSCVQQMIQSLAVSYEHIDQFKQQTNIVQNKYHKLKEKLKEIQSLNESILKHEALQVKHDQSYRLQIQCVYDIVNKHSSRVTTIFKRYFNEKSLITMNDQIDDDNNTIDDQTVPMLNERTVSDVIKMISDEFYCSLIREINALSSDYFHKMGKGQSFAHVSIFLPNDSDHDSLSYRMIDDQVGVESQYYRIDSKTQAKTSPSTTPFFHFDHIDQYKSSNHDKDGAVRRCIGSDQIVIAVYDTDEIIDRSNRLNQSSSFHDLVGVNCVSWMQEGHQVKSPSSEQGVSKTSMSVVCVGVSVSHANDICPSPILRFLVPHITTSVDKDQSHGRVSMTIEVYVNHLIPLLIAQIRGLWSSYRDTVVTSLREIQSLAMRDRINKLQHSLSRYKKLYRMISREASVLLDPPLSSLQIRHDSSQEGSISREQGNLFSPMRSELKLINHPSLLPSSIALHDSCLKILSMSRILLRGDGQAIVLIDPSVDTMKIYRVIYTGTALRWTGIDQGRFGILSCDRSESSMVETVMNSQKIFTSIDGLESNSYNPLIDGVYDSNTVKIIVPVRGQGNSIVGVIIIARCNVSHVSSEDLITAEIISTYGGLSIFWCEWISLLRNS